MKRTQCLILAAALLLLSGCGDTTAASGSAPVASQTVSSSSAETASGASEAQESAELPAEPTGTISLDGDEAHVTGTGITVKEHVATITEEGSFELSGTWTDGQILVDTGKGTEVNLTLNGVDLTASSGSPLCIQSAGQVNLTLIGENTVTDTANYTFAEGESEPDAALYSKADLTIDGEGTLTVNGNYAMAIHGKDTVNLLGGTIILNSVGDGLKGKDAVTVGAADLTIVSGEDGIQSNNTKDSGMGNVTIEAGALIQITAGGDGIKAETKLTVTGGDVTIDAQKDGLQATGDVQLDGGSIHLTTQQDAIQAGGDLIVTDGTYEILSGGGTANAPVHMEGPGFPGWFDTAETEEEPLSAKGLKAGGAMTISGGSMTFDCMDDALHCATALTISDTANLTIASGDDAVHSDDTLEISGGTIHITQSYEGLEGMKITISGGDITLVSSDDGINAAGGSSADTDFGFAGPPMEGGSETLEEATYYLLITGGTLTMDAAGDGLDSNGAFFMQGGTVILCGPTETMNGALDYTTTGQVTGGTILAAGTSGMAQNFDSSSTQCSFMTNTSAYTAENTTITISDASGKVLVEATMPRSFNNVVFSCPELVVGETYTVTCGEETQEVTLTDIITGGGFGFGGPGGPGGGPGGFGGPPGFGPPPGM